MSRCRLVGRTVAVAVAVLASVAVATGTAQATPGISTIGPGPSSNLDGVKCVQTALHLDPDGDFGELTYQAVKDFQRAHGLSVDGAVGPTTGDVLLPSAPDGCIAHVPSTITVPDWVSTPQPGAFSDQAYTDQLLFQSSMSDFAQAKSAEEHGDVIDWSDDGCSAPLPEPEASQPDGFDFRSPCARHDFGYRNYKKQDRFSEANRQRIDSNFKDDMDSVCNKYHGWDSALGVRCRQVAETYFLVVRGCGSEDLPAACVNRYKKYLQLP